MTSYESEQTTDEKLAQIKVLIVDDHAFTRLLIREVLQSLGCAPGNVLEAEDGSAALKLVGENRFHLIVCDWQMEPMDGLTFIRALRDPQKSVDPFVPIILCSAYTERQLVERARDLGVTEVLSKPITVKAIDEKVHAVIDAPRPFVDSTLYFGPDRRRHAEHDAPTEERRKKRRTVVKQVDDAKELKRPE